MREIAEATGAPPGYLIKALQGLAKSGLLSAQRGSNGGFSLRRHPTQLTVLDILKAIDPIERIESCPLGLAAHSAGLCPVHRRIDDALATIERTFAASTIHALLAHPSDQRTHCPALVPAKAARSREPSAVASQANASLDGAAL